jgi:hypothetical protein
MCFPGLPGGLACSKASNSPSSITDTPSCCAFSSLLPASAPATTKSVFFDTEAVTFPPAVMISCPAPSRVSEGRAPVSTKTLPATAPAPGRGCFAFAPAHPGGAQLFDDHLVVRLAAELANTLRDRRADVGNLLQLRFIGR